MRVTRSFFMDFLRSRINYTKVYAVNTLFGQKYLFPSGNLDLVLAFIKKRHSFFNVCVYTYSGCLLASCEYIEYAHRFRYDIY